MDQFIARENIRLFQQRLRVEADQTTRRLIQQLLLEQEDRFTADREFLGELEGTIASFDALIETQQSLVTLLERDGAEAASGARALLDGLTEAQALHRIYHQRIAILARDPPRGS